MGTRVAAKIILAWIGVVLIFFGVGLLGFALTLALAPVLGLAGGAAVAGAIFLVPPFFCAVTVIAMRPARRAPAGGPALLTALFAGLAKETPWIAIVGAGLAGIADLILKYRKPPPN